MIVQNTRLIQKRKFSRVIRCIATGKCNNESIITVGSQDKHLYVLNSRFETLQALEFPQWVRCVAVGDLNGDGNDEIVAGSGDRTFRIYQFKEGEYQEIYFVKFDHFVNSCVIADMTGDGVMEIIAGSWDHTINVFRLFEDHLSLLWSKKFEKRLSYLKAADTNWNGRNELVALFKGGGMSVISADTLEELWSFETEKDLLACDIGALEASGLPMIVVGGNDKNVYFFDCDGKLIHQKSTEDRISALIIRDIDGDGNNELVIGEGAIALNVFKFYGPDLFSMDLKWSKRIHHVINDVVVDDISQDAKMELIYGGYGGAITAIQDFFYGETKSTYTQMVPPLRSDDSQLEEISVVVAQKTESIISSQFSPIPIENIAVGGDKSLEYSPKFSRIYTNRYDRLFSSKNIRGKIDGGYIRTKLKKPYPTPYYRNLAEKKAISFSPVSPKTLSKKKL